MSFHITVLAIVSSTGIISSLKLTFFHGESRGVTSFMTLPGSATMLKAENKEPFLKRYFHSRSVKDVKMLFCFIWPLPDKLSTSFVLHDYAFIVLRQL